MILPNKIKALVETYQGFSLSFFAKNTTPIMEGVDLMNLKLNYEGFENNLIEKSRHLGGIQYLFKFENNFGASVVKHSGSYGHEEDLWELAVIEYYRDGEWYLTYDTYITDDVIGWLTDEDVRELLTKIRELNDT